MGAKVKVGGEAGIVGESFGELVCQGARRLEELLFPVEPLASLAVRIRDEMQDGGDVELTQNRQHVNACSETVTTFMVQSSKLTRRPLFNLTISDIGVKEDTVEAALTKWLSIADQWRAIVLIDECDVFLDRRYYDISRNGVNGVRNCLKTTEVLEINWNGRQIPNALQTAIALAEFETRKMQRPDFEDPIIVEVHHFKEVMNLNEEFKSYLYGIRDRDEIERAKLHQWRNDSFNKTEAVEGPGDLFKLAPVESKGERQ
ncbi:hypothetical protein PG996_014387 [Apiospora saccharicola]|uniref:AAA+ ATPase lid domain-containing protein n=1 Tax=Apiospora saccharicola TaxID=335842 RepID=A0ABR1TKY1_9PEZI